ncbi:alpha/beta hydrolase [Salinicoccus hispanicus]|uniref:Alpha/beta fold hydrolase n=1 Tax=Salinicoccus hispanicus TaxID=157225 RepID=A0A6N8TXR4_9STAP|nr:alpha/beta hydrolase [Salinicoccus hispanicus]MXQ50530.1 alpha/beta fold hydrolase [Salinicoccus hispanicus]
MWKWETDRQPKGVIVVVHDMLEHHEYYTQLISQLRNAGYHVVSGDLPGHGQTTRMNKGHISDFTQYTDRVHEWHEAARAYRLPTFLLGQGLGGLVIVEALRQNLVGADGIILLNPTLAFKQSFINRKNTIRTSIRTTSDTTRFDLGIHFSQFTEDARFLKQYDNDELLVRKVSYHWYRTVINQMKTTTEFMDDFPDVPVLAMLSRENEIIEPFLSAKYIKQMRTKELSLHMLDNIEHSIFQRDDTDVPYYHLERFLNAQLFRIGLMG